MQRTILPMPLAMLALAGMLLPTSNAWAQAPLGTRAIEQDWRVELYVMSEGTRLTSPLFVSGFTIPHVPALFQCAWNHRDIPILEEGGIQLQVYGWNNLLDEQEILTPPWREKLNVDDEVITWTQRLEISNLDYIFTVKDISSKTWGSIPGPYVVRRRFLVWAPPLEWYSYEEIARNSGILMGGNRFKSMTIAQTRFYDVDGEELEPVVPEPPAGRVLFNATDLFESYEFRNP